MLEQLANVGELLGGFGALAALVYLAAQVRQSNRIARASSRQQLLDIFYDRAWEAGTDPELSRILAAGVMRWESLSDREKTTFHNMMSRWLSNIENALALLDEGLVDEGSVAFIGGAMANCINAPGGRAWWAECKSGGRVDPRVVAYLDGLLADPDVETAPFDELFPWWAAMAGTREPETPPS